jgi:peptidyl-prolyl cis-trans isomerase C
MITINDIQVADRPGAVRELLRQRAVEIGLLAAGTVHGVGIEEALERLLEREVRTPEPSDEECRRYYDAHPDLFTAGELAFVRHILFAVTPGVPVAALRAKAEDTLREVQTEPALFEQRAKGLSNCPSGEHGGNLGQLSRGESVPEFDQAVFADAVIGILPRLVNTRYGFHVIAVDGRVPGRKVPFEAVRAQIGDRLRQAVKAKALQQYVAVLAGQADVRGVDLGAAASPLVQ